MLGSIRDILRDPIRRKVLTLLLLFFVFLGVIIGAGMVLNHIRNEHQQRLDNQNARQILAKHIKEDLFKVELALVKIGSLSDTRDISKQRELADKSLDAIDEVLGVLQNGGSISRILPANFNDVDEIVELTTYFVRENQGYVIDVIDLAPKIVHLRNLIDDLSKSAQVKHVDSGRKVSDTELLLKAAKPYLSRSNEHANRILYEANRSIELIKKEQELSIKQMSQIGYTLLLVMSLVAIFVFGQSFSQIGRIIRERRDKNLQIKKAYQSIYDLADALPVGVMIVGSDRKIKKFNRAASDLVQATDPKQIIDVPCSVLICSQCGDTCPVLEKNEPIHNKDTSLQTINGTVVPVLKSSIPMILDNEQVVVESFVDISSLKEAQEKIRLLNEELEERVASRTEKLQLTMDAFKESESRLRQIIDLVPHMIFVKDTSGRFILVNKTLADFYNNTVEEMTGKHLNEISLSPSAQEHMLLSDKKVLETGKPLLIPEHSIDLPSGRQIWVETVKVPFIKASQPAVMGIAMDVTQRHKARRERTALELQLRQSQKMEAIGRLAGGVAHDVNNVLGTILSLASLLKIELTDNPVLLEDSEAIISACSRGKDLTRDLLGFARKGKYLKELFSLNEIVEKTVSILNRTLPKNIRIVTDITDYLKGIEGDFGQIEHALMNVCINASDAMKEGGTLTISTSRARVERETVERFSIDESEHYIALVVSDTGVGMDEITADSAFDPFFTTKPKGEGTGLGLSMVYGAVKNHGGHVSIDSEPGRGTSVNFLFPAVSGLSKVPNVVTGQKSLVPSPKAKGILVVDDEEMVRRSSMRLLTKLGYNVLQADGGAEAVEVYKKNRDQIAIVLLDLIMPQMDGVETFKRLKEMDPFVKVIVLSGYSKGEKVISMLEDGAVGYLQKPYEYKQLIEEIEGAVV